MRKIIFGVLGVPLVAFAQEAEVFVNEGVMSVVRNGVVSTIYNFENVSEGMVTNDGTTYYYRNFANDGIYSTNKNAKTGKVVFTRYENEQGVQILSGDAITEFYNVEFNNPEPIMAFDLKNNIDIYGTADFQDGIIQVDSVINEKTGHSKGMLSFQQGSKTVNTRDASHAEGQVEKIGNEAFQYPIGDEGLYRYARITAPKTMKDAFVGKYILNDNEFFRSNNAKSGVIELLDEKEYWKIEKGGNVLGDIMLTLSWDERTTPKELLKDPAREMHIVRWDEQQQLWVDEGGVADVSAREITTPAQVKGYGYFTLATVKTDWILDGDVVIYNLVSPDGNGKNDYFIIDNINRFPNNKVEIYNRWGIRVYETTSYDSNGNVFRGYSDGRVTISKNEKLPTGTYFYIVSYEYTNDSGSRMIKKSGYLHLENN